MCMGGGGGAHISDNYFKIQTETRKTYKALLDADEFTGFDLSPGYVYPCSFG